MSEQRQLGEQERSKLSQAYSELASETVPPELDRKILDLAESEKPRIIRKWSTPIAIAATITICFSLMLELTEKPQEPAFESRGSRSAAPEQMLPALQPAALGNDPAKSVATPRVTEERATKAPAESLTDTREMPMMEMSGATGTAPALAASLCPAASREKPDSWWLCIAELRGRGLDEQAAEEQRLLQQSFPDFAPPE